MAGGESGQPDIAGRQAGARQLVGDCQRPEQGKLQPGGGGFGREACGEDGGGIAVPRCKVAQQDALTAWNDGRTRREADQQRRRLARRWRRGSSGSGWDRLKLRLRCCVSRFELRAYLLLVRGRKHGGLGRNRGEIRKRCVQSWRRRWRLRTHGAKDCKRPGLRRTPGERENEQDRSNPRMATARPSRFKSTRFHPMIHFNPCRCSLF